jgi:DNA (cytosine-5)-methyltransferase 1
MARILAGLEKFGGKELEPFLVVLRQNMGGRSLDAPIPTLSAQGQHVGVAQPFLMHITHGTDPDRTRSVDRPVPTITTAKRGEIAVVEPFVISAGGAKLRTARGTSQPLPTVMGSDRLAIVEPFVLGQQSGSVPRAVSSPLPTVATDGAIAMVEPFIVQTSERRDERVQGVDEPLRTITATGGRCFGLAEPFLTKYNRTATGAYSVDEPVDTISTRDRFGLVQPVVDGYVLDIHFRMLQPHELAAAMSFPKSYVFAGNREDTVKQIGNSWPGELARALCLEVVSDYASGQKADVWRKARIA